VKTISLFDKLVQRKNEAFQIGIKPRCIRISRRSSSLSALLFLRRLKNSSRKLTTIAFALEPSASAHSFERQPGLRADVEKLRVGKLHASLSGLHDVDFAAVNMAQSKKGEPGQITLYARLFGDCLAQVNGERSVMSGRSSVRRCPSRVVFFSAISCLSRTLPRNCRPPRVQSDFS